MSAETFVLDVTIAALSVWAFLGVLVAVEGRWKR